jgi:hypothetical protein
MTPMLVIASLLGILSTGNAQADRDRAVQMATDALSRVLKVAPESIQLVSIEPVDWPNSSLGCPKPDMAYLPAIVPGFRVRLSVGDRQHEVHTGAGRAIVCGQSGESAESSRFRTITPALAAADRAKEHLASALKVKPEDVAIGRVRKWDASDRACDPPKGTIVKGETFLVELKRGATTHRYRATPEAAWACR